MNRRMLASVAAAAVLAAAPPCRAEVRLVRAFEGSVVHVTTTASGPWTCPGAVNEGVLNPNGDVLGDGPPAAVRASAGCSVAWTSSEQDGLRWARGRAAWEPVQDLPWERAVGAPLLVRTERAWVVAVRAADGRVGVSAWRDGEPRPCDLVPAGDGRILGGCRAGEEARIFLLDREGCLVVVHVLVPDPRPIDVYRELVTCLPGDGPWHQPGAPRAPGRDRDPRAPRDGWGGRDDRDSGDCGYPGGDGDGDVPRDHAGVAPGAGLELRETAQSDGTLSPIVGWTDADGRPCILDLAATVLTPECAPVRAR